MDGRVILEKVEEMLCIAPLADIVQFSRDGIGNFLNKLAEVILVGVFRLLRGALLASIRMQ